jgi:hypothetical protein
MKKLNVFFLSLVFSGVLNSFSIEQSEEKLDSSEKVAAAQVKDEFSLRAEMEKRLQEIVTSLNDEEKLLIQKGISMVAKHVETLYGSDEEFKEFVDWAKLKGLDIQIIINLLPTLAPVKQESLDDEITAEKV